MLTRGPGGTVFVKPQLSGIQLGAILEAIRPRSFGASWIGTMDGLNGSHGNAQGFVDEMRAEGWQRRFNWGNQAAWKSDWLHHSDIGATPTSPSDLWGQENLEWAVVAACGP